MNVGFRGLIGNYTAMIGNLVQIQSLVTEHPTKGSVNKGRICNFMFSSIIFAIFFINYFLKTCVMPF